MKSYLFSGYLLLCASLLAACASDSNNSPSGISMAKGTGQTPTQINTQSLPAPIPGFAATVTTPEIDDLPSKTIQLDQFTKTVEKTKLKLDIQFLSKEAAFVELLAGGESLDSTNTEANGGRSPVTLQLKFKTPKIADDDRQKGYADTAYDVHVVISGVDYHNPFYLRSYDSHSPSYVQLRPQQPVCIVKLLPEIATGCIPNDSASVRFLTRSFTITKTHEVDVQLSGGISIPISIITFSLGGQVTTADSTQVSDSITLQDTEGIFCAGQYFKQVEQHIQVVDVYAVMVDGSLRWRGQALVKTWGIGYKFVATPSESHQLSCDGLVNQLAVGSSVGCSALGYTN